MPTDKERLDWVAKHLKRIYYKGRSFIIEENAGWEWGPHTSLRACINEAMKSRRTDDRWTERGSVALE